MENQLQIHYLEVVTPDVEPLCNYYSQTLGAEFGDAAPELGKARTATLPDGSTVGIRAPMHEVEEPTTRPYYLVSDIAKAVNDANNSGAEILVPPMEIPGRGQCALVAFGAIQSGLWQLQGLNDLHRLLR